MSGKNLVFALTALIALAVVAVSTTMVNREDGTRLTTANLSNGQRDDVRSVVRDYLIENPDVIVEALEIYQARQQASQQERSRQALGSMRDELVSAHRDPVLGPDDATVTIVEFFDYQCPYCKRMTGPLMALLEEDKELRLVFKEFPILGEPSVLASRAALAAQKQGKYTEFHIAMMNWRGQLSQKGIESVAKEIGLNIDRMREDMQSDDVNAAVQANYRLAQAIGVNGTPAFVVGTELVPGAVDVSRLRDLVAKARQAAQ